MFHGGWGGQPKGTSVKIFPLELALQGFPPCAEISWQLTGGQYIFLKFSEPQRCLCFLELFKPLGDRQN